MQKHTTIDTSALSYPQWQELRKSYLGGSDVAVALGRSKYKTPYMLWLEKTDRFDFSESNPVTQFGQLWEPYAREHFTEVSGLDVIDEERMRIHPEYPMLAANIDGVILSQEQGYGILELKTTTTMNFRVNGSAENMPVEYRLQIQHYLGVTGYEYAYLLVYYRDTCTYSKPLLIKPDHKLIKKNNRYLADWWNRYIEQDTPPPLSTEDDLKLRYPSSQHGVFAKANEAILSRYHALKQVRERLSQLEELKISMELDLKKFMGEAEILTDEGHKLASWKSSTRSRFDTTAFRQDHPKLYNQYLTHNNTRIFRLK